MESHTFQVSKSVVEAVAHQNAEDACWQGVMGWLA